MITAAPTLLTVLGIAVAGGLGAAARFAVDQGIPARVRARFPVGILLVNLSGSFALGVVTGLALAAPITAVLASGFLGGYTTFSTASLDTARMILARRPIGAVLHGLGTLVGSVLLALLGIGIGAVLAPGAAA
ncbi:fluoride efflux transporter FluC [Leucobacter chromiireducens]|uniref:fluoride efflux transporter FluC n=1 Tax=Leucobacter chromiireducens TaxID=283877 RepID=UPI001F151F7C|nr:CrcB family protein [Leucobacter chromiireducens]